MVDRTIDEAAREGDVDRVRELVEADPSLVNRDDEHEWRPVFHAALRKHFDVVAYLIDQGADLSAGSGYVMHYAGEIPGNERVVEILVRYGALDAHVEPRNESARQFIYAVFLANQTRVSALLRAGPGLVDERYARGDTALHHASRNGDVGIVAELLDHGADVNAMSAGAHFPLYCAAGHGHVDTTALLLERGADVGMRLIDGKTVEAWLREYLEHHPDYHRCLDLVTGR